MVLKQCALVLGVSTCLKACLGPANCSWQSTMYFDWNCSNTNSMRCNTIPKGHHVPLLCRLITGVSTCQSRLALGTKHPHKLCQTPSRTLFPFCLFGSVQSNPILTTIQRRYRTVNSWRKSACSCTSAHWKDSPMWTAYDPSATCSKAFHVWTENYLTWNN